MRKPPSSDSYEKMWLLTAQSTDLGLEPPQGSGTEHTDSQNAIAYKFRFLPHYTVYKVNKTKI